MKTKQTGFKQTGFKLAAAALLVAGSATGAFAQAHVHAHAAPHTLIAPEGAAHAVTPDTRVYENGKLIGQDPDPNVRMMLQKDFTFQ